MTHRFSQLGLQSQSSSSSLLNGAVTSLAETASLQVDARLLDYLSLEMINMIYDASALRLSKLDERIDTLEAGVELGPPAPGSSTSEARQQQHKERLAQEARSRLEGLGFKVGWSLAERLSRDRQPFAKPAAPAQGAPPPAHPFEPLDLVKFLCREVWTALYAKQIDNLRTNHRGVFVLHDGSFTPLRAFSCSGDVEAERERMVEKMLDYLYMPSGVIRGALACLGLQVTVSPELGQTFASCAFQIKVIK